MSTCIALAGQPNAGKTTLFNALTGSNQFVGNWPGVTIERKEGRLKQHKDVTVVDLPGIYSLSPYSPEEVISRNFLIEARPDVILNIVDGMNLERNLYLTTQLLELGIPVVVAINMMDEVNKRGDQIDSKKLAKRLGCDVVEMSALKGTGIEEAVKTTLKAVHKPAPRLKSTFNGTVEHSLAHIEEFLLHDMPEGKQRFYSVKLFERDKKILEELQLSPEALAHIERDINKAETELEDDAESIIVGQRYQYIESILNDCCTRKIKKGLNISQKIDRVVTNRILALPIFVVIMVLVYYLSITTVGGWATDWANDGLFGDGYFLFGKGSEAYGEAGEEYDLAQRKAEAFVGVAANAGVDVSALGEEELSPEAAAAFERDAAGITGEVQLIETDEGGELYAGPVTLEDWVLVQSMEEPDPAAYGTWIPGLPVLLSSGLDKVNAAPWLHGLVIDGILAGVGAVLGFVPQMLVLFLCLAFLEACGYMARIAFILDRIFRRFGLSGKSIIPMLISTGCGVPGVLASRTIESPRERRMTVMTTTFVPCGAKLPIIGLIASAFFGGAWWVAPSAYFIGIAAVLFSGAILKKTRMFLGEESPFVMELPLYHLPTVRNVLRSMWERSWDFMKRAGTIILLASIFIWFTSNFGFVNGSFALLGEGELESSILAVIGNGIDWVFAPLGFGTWQASVATFLGLVAKEGVVSTMAVLYGMGDGGYAALAGALSVGAAFAFMLFNLLCAPCFAAIGAIRQEMNSAKWFWFAIGYQTIFAYAVAFCFYQFWSLISGGVFGAGTIIAVLVVLLFLFLLFRPSPNQKGKGLVHISQKTAG